MSGDWMGEVGEALTRASSADCFELPVETEPNSEDADRPAGGRPGRTVHSRRRAGPRPVSALPLHAHTRTLGAGRLRRCPGQAVALVLVAATIAGCGASSTTSTSGTKKPAKQILEEAAAAFGRVHSVAIDGNVRIKKRAATIALELERPGDLSLKIGQASQAASVIVTGGSAYIKANAAFYEGLHQQIPQAAVSLLANRWFKSSEGVGELTKGLNLGTLGRCMTRELGTLEVTGASTVNGQPAVEITSAGDRPGTTPARFYVAAKGEPFLLRAIATGTQRPGGTRSGECNEATEATEAGEELTFSRYNSHMNIVAPAGALEPSQFARNQQT